MINILTRAISQQLTDWQVDYEYNRDDEDASDEDGDGSSEYLIISVGINRVSIDVYPDGSMGVSYGVAENDGSIIFHDCDALPEVEDPRLFDELAVLLDLAGVIRHDSVR